jgi:glycosyltransferase involved in cell wall biosynthesis
LKILFIAPLDSIHSKRWIEFFSRREDTEVQVLCFGKQVLPVDNAVVHALGEESVSGKTLKGFVTSLRRLSRRRRLLRELVQSCRPDVVHIHWIYAPAYWAARRFDAPIISTAWGSDVLIHTRNSFLQRRAVRQTLRASTWVTCDAVHVKERMVSFGANPEKVKIIYFGTNCEEYSPANRDSGLASALGWGRSDQIVVSLRALKPIYDVETLIRAIPPVAEKIPQARFVIVGDGEQRNYLQQLSKELGVEKITHFACRLSDEDMRRYVASADVYVSTSTSDAGIAASTAEAMASGVPVVITDFGNNAAWLDSECAGRLFPIRDAAALAARISDLLKDEGLRKQMGEAGRSIILERNSYHREMERVLELYRGLAGK